MTPPGDATGPLTVSGAAATGPLLTTPAIAEAGTCTTPPGDTVGPSDAGAADAGLSRLAAVGCTLTSDPAPAIASRDTWA